MPGTASCVSGYPYAKNRNGRCDGGGGVIEWLSGTRQTEERYIVVHPIGLLQNIPIALLVLLAAACCGTTGQLNPAEKNMLNVQVLSIAGCQATPPTMALVASTAAELGIGINLEQVVITSPAKAEAHRFLGSPSVQINGLDIEPSLRGATQYGVT